MDRLVGSVGLKAAVGTNIAYYRNGMINGTTDDGRKDGPVIMES
jgi:hypothetical protein